MAPWTRVRGAERTRQPPGRLGEHGADWSGDDGAIWQGLRGRGVLVPAIGSVLCLDGRGKNWTRRGRVQRGVRFG